jgi:hypothetical protein
VLDGGAEQVSDGEVQAPKTAQPVVFQSFRKAWSANSGLFHFFGVPISSKFAACLSFRRDQPHSSHRIRRLGVEILQATASRCPLWTDLKGLGASVVWITGDNTQTSAETQFLLVFRVFRA